MYVDSQLQFSDAQAVTATALSTNYVDAGVARALGVGRPLYIVVICVVAMTDSSSDSTVAVTLETDGAVSGSPANLTSGNVVLSLGTFAALSAVGTRLIAHLPPEPANAFERYIAVKYTVANGNLTTGSFDAFITTDIAAWAAYPGGYTVS